VGGGRLIDRLLTDKVAVISGVESGWSYEKRSDGSVKVWAYVESGADISDAWGNMFMTSSPIVKTLPDFFSEIPTDILVTARMDWFLPCGPKMTDLNTLKVNIIGPSSGTRTCAFEVVIKGRWK